MGFYYPFFLSLSLSPLICRLDILHRSSFSFSTLLDTFPLALFLFDITPFSTLRLNSPISLASFSFLSSEFHLLLATHPPIAYPESVHTQSHHHPLLPRITTKNVYLRVFRVLTLISFSFLRNVPVYHLSLLCACLKIRVFSLFRL